MSVRVRLPALDRRLWRDVPVIIFGALLLSAAGEGPDFGHYLDWSRAFWSGDIFQIRSNILSPAGVPFTIWSHGSGLLFALGGKPAIQTPDCLPALPLGAMLVGWVSALVFWWTMLRIVRLAAGGDGWLTLIGVGAAFVGTHAGFYSLRHATESLSYPFVALLVWRVLERKRQRMPDALLVGVATAFLLVIRSYLMVFALPIVAVTVYHFLQEGGERGWPRTLAATLLVFVPIALAGAQIALSNRWMTGALNHSPYTFQTGSFQSLSWFHPELWATLAHPLHGLLLYHPLYAIACLALIVLFLRTDSRSVRLACVVIGGAVLATFYIQAAYYTWWLGIDTFGARGVSAGAVVLVPVLVRVIASSQKHEARAWTLATLIACLWSYLQLVQPEPTSYFSYAELLAGQRDALVMLLPAALVVGAVLSGWLVYRARRGSDVGLPQAAGLLLAVMTLGYLASRPIVTPEPALTRLAVVAAFVGLAAVMSLRFAWPHIDRERLAAGAERLVSWGMAAAFVMALALFANLALQTERRIAAGTPPPRAYRYAADYPVDAALLAYREYLDIPGFDDKKAALLELLQARGALSPPVEPPDNAETIASFHEPGSSQETLRLLAYDLSGDVVRPGDALEVSLVWQSAAPTDTNWSVFIHLIDPEGIVVAQFDTLLGLDMLATGDVEPGTTWRDTHAVRIPDTAYAPNEATVQVGLYDPETNVRMAPTEGDASGLELAKVSFVPRGESDVPNPVTIDFGDQLDLVGYQMSARTLAAGDTLTMDLYWRGRQAMNADYAVSPRVADGAGNLWSQADVSLAGERGFTSSWQAGELVATQHELTLNENTPPGQHQVVIGMYAITESDDFIILRRIVEEGQCGEEFPALGPIRVVE